MSLDSALGSTINKPSITARTSLVYGREYYHLVQAANRRILLNPDQDAAAENREDAYSWKIAPVLLGAEIGHKIFGDPEDMQTIQHFYDQLIDESGRWLAENTWPEHAMKGYTLLYLEENSPQERYQIAAARLAELFLKDLQWAEDGCLTYRPGMKEILVDTLAMICPFLARYAHQLKQPEALDLAITQLRQFFNQNVDPDTHLPYHGYYPRGSKRLGMHAWGRGTGWFMLGLIDTLAYLPPGHPDFNFLLEAYELAANSLLRYQHGSGNWGWAILHDSDTPDSSATSLIGYNLARGRQLDLLDWTFDSAIETAARAQLSVTFLDGTIQNSSSECLGLGKYPQNYGPHPWLQGSGTAFLGLHLSLCTHI